MKSIAKVFAGQIRQSDVLVRYDGSEFTIILKETNLAGVQTVAQTIHHAMKN